MFSNSSIFHHRVRGSGFPSTISYFQARKFYKNPTVFFNHPVHIASTSYPEVYNNTPKHIRYTRLKTAYVLEFKYISSSGKGIGFSLN
jgi:hypothetical protein